MFLMIYAIAFKRTIANGPFTTAATFQSEISELNANALVKVLLMSLTLPVDQRETSELNLEQSRNIACMLPTREISQRKIILNIFVILNVKKTKLLKF